MPWGVESGDWSCDLTASPLSVPQPSLLLNAVKVALASL